jgi:DNA-dependent RNA polymerase auxiliary subunit epsilon
MMSSYLTITEIAEQTDIPRSTCSRYLASFDAFFAVKGGSRLKKYESSAVNVLKPIKQLYEDGLETHEIFDMLKNEFPIVINSDERQETQEQALAVPALATSDDLEEIKQALDEQKQFNQALLQKMNEQHLYYEKKFEELKYDRDLISSLRDSMQQRKLESSEHEQKLSEQMVSIQQQLKEMEQDSALKSLSEQMVRINEQLMAMKESAVSKEEQPKKKKGLWAWLSGE